MPNTRKLVDLTIEETSGVDHPAHLHEGWLVRKNETAVLDQALADLDDQPEPDQGTKMDLEAEVTIDAPADDAGVIVSGRDTASVRATYGTVNLSALPRSAACSSSTRTTALTTARSTAAAAASRR